MTTFSIVVIDTIHYEKSQKAVEATLSTLHGSDGLPCVTKLYWISDKPFTGDITCEVEWVRIQSIQSYPRDYNWVTLVLLPLIIKEDYFFIVHDDGYAVNSAAWTNEFLEYDYIGATWPDWCNIKWASSNRVGNGGFTMRSQRLLRALKATNLQYETGGEDYTICVDNGPLLEQQHNIRFAPPELADRFSIELNMTSPWLGHSLGFHGRHGVAGHYGCN